ncbi:MAG: YwaF family protein [Clostridia bacterium]|nr:YwaF family protein [Clostridia bacterium]
MTFKDWLFSNYPPNSGIGGQWGALHIATLVVCVLAIVAIAFLFRGKSEKTRYTVLLAMALCIAFFELSRRIINISKGNCADLTSTLRTLLPRPWCAISCWLVMITVFTRKKFLYNFTAITALLNALVFFAYPSVGFNNKYILFENVYSIGTHSLLLISAVSMITLKFTDFRYKRGDGWTNSAILELITLAIVVAYAFLEIFVLKIEADPLYFMDGNEAQGVLGLDYPIYLMVYLVFLAVWLNAFYLVQGWIAKKQTKDK